MKDKNIPTTISPIEALEAQDEIVEPIDEITEAIDDITQFRAAVGQAQLAGVKEIFVTPRILKHINGGIDADALTYGNPSVLISVQKDPTHG